MTKQFNVNDTVKYTSPCKGGGTVLGIIKSVDAARFNYGNDKMAGYNVDWSDGSYGWISDQNLSLESTMNKTSVSEAKELKISLQSEILRLIQEFNKETSLQIKDIDLDRERTLGGDCFYRINVKVEI